MKKNMRFALVAGAVSLLQITIAGADASVTGTIQTLHINLESNMAHVQLQGKPAFDGGTGCNIGWTGNSLDDERFMTTVWPLLVLAKARSLAVTISVNGCTGSYPRIYAVDVEPRS